MTTKIDRFWLKINSSGVAQHCHSEVRVNFSGSSQNMVSNLSVMVMKQMK